MTVNGAYALYAVGAGSDIGWLLSECGIERRRESNGCIGADDLLQFIGGIDPGLGRLPTVRAVITVNEPLRVQKMM